MNSSLSSEFIAPWALENKDMPFDWFILIIDETPPDVESTIYYNIIEAIDGSFSNNEWRFYQFTIFYQQYLNLVTWHTEIVRHCTYERLQYNAPDGGMNRLNGNYFIIQEEIPFIKFVLYTNDELLERLHEASMDYDVFDEEIIPYVVSGYKLFGMKKYFNNVPELHYIRHLLFRLTTLYLLIYLNIVNYDYDYDSDWFSLLSQSMKNRIEKNAKFYVPVEDLGYSDIYNEYYVFYVFLVRCCNYYGRIVEDYVEGEVVNK